MTANHYDDRGHGPAVILLHGFPFDRLMWREQIDLLSSRGYRAIAPDLRGLGENQTTSQVSTMEEMARDVATLMDDLNLDKAIVCGLSMGGYVSFDFAHLFPERLRALILAGTRAPADNDQERKVREQQAEKMLAEGMAGIAETTLPKLLAQQTLAEKPAVANRVREMILRSNPRGAAAAQRGMAERRDYSSDLPGINVPTLVIVGREDPIRPVADAEFMHRQIRDSRLVIIEDAAHMTNMEQPEVFNAALIDFLELIH